ncbi:MAG: 2-C-methyl-D-erythritol 2,4-cyclodiphosphate synthase [Gammaproteobacteria bacterium]|nr:2-C-methyl-D-erythritol 2,4-cyclodiphosphate synthase [Gammaproteobacteria bacterium]|tara:strand:- start:1659 stop:2804 length:1146 start_codon:yes stop_codon:yes gene_type:complete
MKTNSLLVIIAAAGIGKRYESNIPKQYIKLNGKSIIESAVRPFLDSSYVAKIIIAISKEDNFIKDQDFYISKKIEYVQGGFTRQESINNALKSINENYEYIVTHDAARPNISEDDLINLYHDINNSESSCSFLYTPVYDSLKKRGPLDKTMDKNEFYLVQTPQISKFNDLKNSIQRCIDDDIDAPDESFAIEYSNLPTSKVKGKRSNIKITKPEDIEILDKFLTRSGLGFDLHKYESGNGIVLGGFKIDCDYKIIAHSDGDVLLHSIADSILGAAGLGDIGKFFSDQDEANKDIDSSKIIEFCLNELKILNLEIYNIDTTIICEFPKINPYREDILDKLSNILKIPISKIGLKATTSEKIGIIGSNKAIAVQSLVNLREVT